jgi:hypothetical protein
MALVVTSAANVLDGSWNDGVKMQRQDVRDVPPECLSAGLW